MGKDRRRRSRVVILVAPMVAAFLMGGCGPPSYPASRPTPDGQAHVGGPDAAAPEATPLQPAEATAYPGPGRVPATGPIEGLAGSLLISSMSLSDPGAPVGPMGMPGSQVNRYDLATRAMHALPSRPGQISFGLGGITADGSSVAEWTLAMDNPTGGLTETLGSLATEEAGAAGAMTEPGFELVIKGLNVPAEPVVVSASPSYGAVESGLVWDGPDRLWYLDPGETPAYSSPGITAPPTGDADLHRVQLTATGETGETARTATDEVVTTVDLDAVGDGGHVMLASADQAAGRVGLIFYEIDQFVSELAHPTLVLVDIATGEVLSEAPLADATSPDGIGSSPDGRWVAAINGAEGSDPYVRVVEIATGESRDIETPSGAHGPLVWSTGDWLGWSTMDGWELANADDPEQRTLGLGEPRSRYVEPTRATGATSSNEGELTSDQLVAIAPDGPIGLFRAGVVGMEGPLGGQAGRFYAVDFATGAVEWLEELGALDPAILAWIP